MTLRVPKANIYLPGVDPSASTLLWRDTGRRIGAADSTLGLIQAQVIAWPWSTDEIGVSFPSGIVGIRTVGGSRSTEEAQAIAGDGDDWIAVPATLPSGYTARRRRDNNRGPLGVTRRRGNAYLVVAANNPGSDLGASYFAPYFSVNGMAPASIAASTSPLVPSFRAEGGGGTTKVSWWPMNVSRKVLKGNCVEGTPYHVATDTMPSQILPLTTWSYTLSGSTYAWNGGAAYVQVLSGVLDFHIGWRNIRLRAGLTYGGANPSHLNAGASYYRLFVSHNADGSLTATPAGSGLASVIDYDSGWTSSAGMSTHPSFPTVFYRDHDTGVVQPATRTLQNYIVTMFVHSADVVMLAGVGRAGYASSIRDYETGFMASPRVDVPPWWTATGPALIAPGGV